MIAHTHAQWSRGTKLRSPALAPPIEPPTNTSSPADERDWRSARATSATASPQGDSPAPSAPAERRKLNLAPRSAAPAPSSTESTPSKGLFGSAKPVDSAAREREAAEKLAKRDQERRQARAEEAKKEEDKARAFADERMKAIKDAQEKAKAEAMGKTYTPTPSTAGQHKGGKRTGDRQVGEDGFEVAKGARAARDDKPAPVRKESTTRTGFSFAAAAGKAYGVSSDNKVDGVEEVTEGVKDVSV